MRTNTNKITLMGLFVAVALILHLVERILPAPFMVPGAKLGLANIITIVSLMVFGSKDAFLILLSRIILSSVFGSGVSGFMYSISGGMLSLFMMIILVKAFKERVSLIGISVSGAFFHSLGQVIMAVLLFQNIRLFGYLPIMLITSIISGVFVGFVGEKLKVFLERLYHEQKVI